MYAWVETADRGHTMDKHSNAWVENACGRALQVSVFIEYFCEAQARIGKGWSIKGPYRPMKGQWRRRGS